jgi:hypothetical protein
VYWGRSQCFVHNSSQIGFFPFLWAYLMLDVTYLGHVVKLGEIKVGRLIMANIFVVWGGTRV